MSTILRDPRVEITPDVRLLPRSDGKIIIFDRRRPLGKSTDGVFDTLEQADRAARAAFPPEPKKTGPAKQSKSDDEAFAAMARAMRNGFAKHEPAYADDEESP